MMHIHLISGPRNISTALMYSFAQRNDTVVVDEPYYGFYLAQTKLAHPGSEEVIATMECDAEKITKDLLEKKSDKEIFFIKNMAHHLLDIDLSFAFRMKNIFLIRDPKQIITSYHAVRSNPTLDDIGIKKQLEIYNFLLRNKNTPLVLDSNEVLTNPEVVLSKLCIALGIPFDEKMLSWKAGARAEDGSWAKYWYSNVHQSTGFEKQKTSDREIPSHLVSVYKEALPYYNQLNQHSIKA
jgi:ribosomal protein L9